ncbi:hypothetical protein LZ554_008342 [Drepanopeziza brunnea f. sp. 'monogermtubi']|nr:hypothetical protein LZ554_008342 [Drepanopeziza brunnea f. sp. 'monogermtubi']
MARSHYNPKSPTRDSFFRLPPSISAQIQRFRDGNLVDRLFRRPIFRSASASGPRESPFSMSTVRSCASWARQQWHPRNLLRLPHLFVLVWVLALLWGERWVFQSSVESCNWKSWERWPKEATPHHLVFIADPQLVDAHSYPGRQWPLDKLTIKHTDNYMKRAYISLQKFLHPDTVFFLGDLFDGGREWKTANGNTDDPSWMNGLRPAYEQSFVEKWRQNYGENYWLQEYDRFGRIFYDFWNLKGAEAGPWQRGRKIISTLPGNHDLGFGDNIKLPIRNRFEAYFGEGNRVDVIGNHTFVSVDSVSLSAGASEHDVKEISEPVEEFLENVKSLKRKAVARELSIIGGEEKVLQYAHEVEDASQVDWNNLPSLDPGPDSPELPTILLTHVPLYRDPGTPCGPKREHWPPETPPKGQLTPVNPDLRNALSISKGYQYQNVLSESDSVKLIDKIGNVSHVFSGDDHDYCEVVHSPAKNNAREITVKSTSWAMGVRKPGFLMLSMWNPIDAFGVPLYSPHSGHGSTSQGAVTMESHLCLLPDQIGIFIRYAILVAFTITILITRAILTPVLHLTPFAPWIANIPGGGDTPLLPATKQDLKREEFEDAPSTAASQSPDSSTSSTSSTHSNPTLAPRSSAARTRPVSPLNGYGLPPSQIRYPTGPLINQAGNYGNGKGSSKWGDDFGKPRPRKIMISMERKPLTPLGVFWRETWTSIWRVTWCVVLVYSYLAWYG